MKDKYIIVSKKKSGNRAIYYEPSVGRTRLYRSGYPKPGFKNLKLKKFLSKAGAQHDCDFINEAHNDNFKVIKLTPHDERI